MLTLDQFRSRPLTVRVLDHCDGCKQLKDDVQKRSNYWPHVAEQMCCGACFTKAISQATGLAC
jgi:hypothetical protein